MKDVQSNMSGWGMEDGCVREGCRMGVCGRDAGWVCAGGMEDGCVREGWRMGVCGRTCRGMEDGVEDRRVRGGGGF